ncbi:MAG: DUF6094 domain-containing protein [Kofleriaceae bacterium]
MARLGSVQVGGFYATWPELLPSIAALVEVDRTGDGEHAFLDACAGEGEAILEMVRRWMGRRVPNEHITGDFRLYVAELEETRAQKLERALWASMDTSKRRLLKGDAFMIQWEGGEYGARAGATVQWLNPPYDTDHEMGRLEERWLRRFGPATAVGGALLFLVPYYALEHSAATLATHFEDLHCFRFPDPYFEPFKQVLVVARRRLPMLAPDARAMAMIRQWGAAPSSIPTLPNDGPAVIRVAGVEDAGFGEWQLAAVDVQSLLNGIQPWHMTDRSGRVVAVPGIIPPEPFSTLLAPTFPVAVPPKPAHIAAGIASGALSGALLAPDDPSSGLPSLVVKGTFRREFHTVSEKTNRDGDVTGLLQEQRPRLEITVLDLESGRYHKLGAKVDVTGADTIERFTAGDLLAHYGRSLLATLRTRCPALHDPTSDAGETPDLPHLNRTLYTAQAHAARAVLKLLDLPDEAAIVLGEIGSGKSTVALTVAAARGARRVIILCPPHLLKSWQDQAAAVVPWARTVIIEDITGIDRLRADTSNDTIIAILSREAAKLGHAWDGVPTGPTSACPKCGARPKRGLWHVAARGGRELHLAGADLAKHRARCAAQTTQPKNEAARLCERFASILGRATAAPSIRAMLRGRMARRAAQKVAGDQEHGPSKLAARWPRARTDLAPLVRAVGKLVRNREEVPYTNDHLLNALSFLLLGLNNDELTATIARDLYQATLGDTSTYGPGSRQRAIARDILLLLPPGGDTQAKLIEELQAHGVNDGAHIGASCWSDTAARAKALATGSVESYRPLQARDGVLCLQGKAAGSVEAAVQGVDVLTTLGRWARSKACGEPLYQAIPEPRRYPVAHYIARRAPRLFDLVIVDEAHEYANGDSAQSLAAQQLFALRIPTVVLTGSVMNGYASSLFTLLWCLSSAFRTEFSRDDEGEFVRRYGYLKQVVEMRDQAGDKVSFGAVTDRVERVERVTGQAPGVLPALLLRHLLPIAVTLQIEDLCVDLPPCHEVVAHVEPGPTLGPQYERLKAKLLQQIRTDRFVKDKAGRLFGQLAELPSYLDRATCDVGNSEGGRYEIRYPENVGGDIVAAAEGMPADEHLPKEAWLIETVRRELAEDRNVLVFGWHAERHARRALLERLAHLLEQATGEAAPILWAEKVPPKKRELWIDKEVIGRKRRMLVCNPVVVQTGLNNLVHFASEVWHENPACNPQIRRQAKGRVYRIGQKLTTRIYTPIYKGTSQELMHRLLLYKVGVSEAADGIDATGALMAAGVGDARELAGGDIGQVLYTMLTREET